MDIEGWLPVMPDVWGDTAIWFDAAITLREPGFIFADGNGDFLGAWVQLTHDIGPANETKAAVDKIFGTWRVYIQQTRNGTKYGKKTNYRFFHSKADAVKFVERYFENALKRANKNFRKIPW